MTTRKEVERLIKERDNALHLATYLRQANEDLIKEISHLRKLLVAPDDPNDSFPSHPLFPSK